MSQKTSFLRKRLIIRKLRIKPASFQEIAGFLKEASEHQEYNLGISIRTFQRDIKEIQKLFDITIQYNKSERTYEIKEELSADSERLFEAFDIADALNIAERFSDIILFEKTKQKGTENIRDIVYAIKNHYQIQFVYQKFWEEEFTIRKVEPYALKEFEKCWYLLSKDLKDNRIKTFGLDRLTALSISKIKFSPDKNFDANEFFKYSFGIINPDDQEVYNIILSFSPGQGKFIKTLPLHDTQEILIDNEDELRIKLQLYITIDFVMKILSYGDEVKVIKPKFLINKLRQIYKNALKQYEQ